MSSTTCASKIPVRSLGGNRSPERKVSPPRRKESPPSKIPTSITSSPSTPRERPQSIGKAVAIHGHNL